MCLWVILSVEAPLLARKSAPSSIIVKKLQQAFPDDDDNPILPLTAEFIDEEVAVMTRTLFFGC